MEATVQLAKLENCLGSDGLKICNSLTFGTDENQRHENCYYET